MRRSGLLVAAVLVLPLTALTLREAGGRPTPAAAPAARGQGERLRQAVWRWRDGGPRHWRDCLLQR
jgi:hypothetical protein